MAHPWTWWPYLTPDVCHLVAGLDTWDIPEYSAENVLVIGKMGGALSVLSPSPVVQSGQQTYMYAREMVGHALKKLSVEGQNPIFVNHRDVKLQEKLMVSHLLLGSHHSEEKPY